MNLSNTVLIFISLLNIQQAFAISFIEAAKKLSTHESVQRIKKSSLSVREGAGERGSWGDPMFKVSAKNYPKDSLKDNETPMTGLEFGVSQKIALSTKYGNIQNAMTSLANSLNYDAKNKELSLVKGLWEVVILRRKMVSEKIILEENYSWIKKILKVSKKLYANGRTSQQALLDIQIRKSELEVQLSNKSYELSQLEDRLNYLVVAKGGDKFKYNSVPWKVLSTKASKIKDFKELSLKSKLNSKSYGLTASKQNFLPDVTVGLGYTKRSNIDNRGDFVGASISFPLPFSGKKYSAYGKAVNEKYSAKKELENYKRSKDRDSKILEKEIKKVSGEVSILTKKTIKFAKNSRKITAKSYSLGNSSYVELLQSELKLQKMLMKKVMLVAKRDIKKVTLRYILGESLYE